MKIFKTVSNLLLLVATVFLGYSYINKKGIFSGENKKDIVSTSTTVEREVIRSGFSGLVNQDGEIVDSKDFAGKHMLVIFGFSSCKHVCPAELGIASQLLNKLGQNANKLNVVFITVDPKNDTVERLSEYHKAFDSRIQMLTGSESDIQRVVNNYMVYVNNPGAEKGDIDHSAYMYLIGPEGSYVGHFTPDFNEYESQCDELLAFINKYLHS
ncbi:SCO family protein [Candidatus Anaplasma sp. TIGMIC]|uniref:SCO family protein n=1 Tax=Candidatus Anaplasma sp. TIGMIC TaxID=3020713 RepID=UPI00232B5FA0|nr:SCO family protein [Candidatus Anaplasma sp. TIGMIC]MDB1135442.1 SCO family protein [Candidatus Anaplasma sp. TIGMIC]